MTKRKWIAIGVCAMSLVAVVIFATRPKFERPTFPGGSTYHAHGIEISFPRGWQQNEGRFIIGGKFRGEPIVAAWENGERYGDETVASVVVRRLPTKGAKSSYEFASIDHKRLTGANIRETGSWQLEQTSSQYVSCHENNYDYLDVYVISPKSEGWWITLYAPKNRLTELKPLFEKITKTILFD